MPTGLALILGAMACAFVLGQYEISIKNDCTERGEFSIGSTVYSCTPVALTFAGKRLPLKEDQ